MSGSTVPVSFLRPRSTLVTPMYGPAVRCKRFRRSGFLVLHQCIRPRIGASLVLRAAMDISARSISLADRPRIGGPKGSPVFDRAGKTVLHLIDFSRRPRQVNLGLHGGGILLFIHPISLVRSRLSPVPTCRLLTASRAGLVEAGRRSDLAAMCAP